MPNRRELLGAVALLGLTAHAGEALAQRRAPAHRAPAPPPVPTSPASTPLGPVDTIAKQAILIDTTTGATLLDKNSDERMTPSSMTKLMTMYVVFDMLKQGRLRMDQTLPVSERAWRMGGSKMFVELGSQVPVEKLIQGVIVQSGNDACVVFAEAISGSEDQFVVLMNDYGRKFGLKGSNFRNASGWPDPDHYMTARDLTIVARRLMNDFPQESQYYNERSFEWNGIKQANRNPLLARMAGADGLKTGHTEDGGYGLVGTAKRGDRRLLLVINGLAVERSRGEEGERLLEWGFREFDNVTLFRAADTVESAPVYLGDSATVPLVGGRDLILTLPRSWRRNLEVKVSYDSPLKAPVAKGAEVGRINVSGQGVPEMTLPLIAGADVGRMGLVSRIPAVVGHWVSGS